MTTSSTIAVFGLKNLQKLVKAGRIGRGGLIFHLDQLDKFYAEYLKTLDRIQGLTSEQRTAFLKDAKRAHEDIREMLLAQHILLYLYHRYPDIINEKRKIDLPGEKP